MNKRLVLLVASLTFCMSAYAGHSQDSGRIVEIFVNTNGAIALRLDNAFPNAFASKQCPNGDGTWAGTVLADPIFKATLLMAKSRSSPVVVTIEGCEGGWFKIIDIYVR